MKGQMFIVSIIFLIVMVFAVQQSLLRYKDIQSTDPFLMEDTEIMTNIEKSFSDTLKASPSCADAEQNMKEVVKELERGRRRGFRVDVQTEMACGNWKTSSAVMLANVSVESRSVNTKKHMEFVRL